MKRIFVLLFLIFVVVGCSNSTPPDDKEDKENNKLEIVDSMTSIGAVDGDTTSFDKQKLTYDFTISNKGKVKVGVLSIKTVLSEWAKERVIEENPSTTINEDSIEVRGYVIFDTKGLTKEDIIENLPLITGIELTPEGGEDMFLKREFHKE